MKKEKEMSNFKNVHIVELYKKVELLEKQNLSFEDV